MKFCLYSALCVMLMMQFSVFAETDNGKENTSPKTTRSIWQRIFPRTGDIEGTVLQHGTDTPFVEAEVRIVETDQQQKTNKDGTFRFIEIPVGTYTLSISHPTYNTPTEIPIEIRAGETLRGRFYPSAAVPFINTTDSGDIDGYVYSQTTGKPLAEAEVRFIEIDVSGRTDASGNFRFIAIAPGTYTLSITHATHKIPTITRVAVTAGGTTQVKIYCRYPRSNYNIYLPQGNSG